MIELKLRRKKHTDKQTVGVMEVCRNNVFECCFATLEQEWNNNKTSNSCIPKGSYIVNHYNSKNHPGSFILADTSPRTHILIHKGNYNTHTAGCILIGLGHKDINSDGYLDVIHSTEAMNRLNDICKGEDIILIDIE